MKYRGKTKKGKWVEGYYCIASNTHLIIKEDARLVNPCGGLVMDIHPNYYIDRFIKVIPDSVAMSTGLKDKNGKDLDWWEGDLLEEDGGKIMEIVYENGCFWGVWVKHREHKQPLYKLFDWIDAIKKIGTVFDNPELLK